MSDNEAQGNARSSGYERNALDWYQEPRWSVDALLDVETFHGTTWDPACGGGNIPEAFKARGLDAFGSDVADRGYGLVHRDFFIAPMDADNIVSNPPFNVAEQWVRHALTRTTRKVAILQRLAFLEGMKRSEMFRTTPLSRVWVFSRRVSMPPGGSGIEAKGGSVAYAWLVWEHGHVGPPALGWVQ